MSDVEEIVNKVFTDDAVFTHPFIISRGKKSIARTYQLWKLVNKQIKFDIENAGKLSLTPWQEQTVVSVPGSIPGQTGVVREVHRWFLTRTHVKVWH